MASFKAKFPVLQEQFVKNHRGPFAPSSGPFPPTSPRWGLVRNMSCWGGGGGKGPHEISQTTGPISKFQTPFDSPVRELPVKGQKFDPAEVTDDVTGQVKGIIFYFSGLVTSASKISMLSGNKANESAWIVSLTSVSIMSCALWP